MKYTCYFVISFTAILVLGGSIYSQRLDSICGKISDSIIGKKVSLVVVYAPNKYAVNEIPTDTSEIQEIRYVFTRKPDSVVVQRLTSEYYRGKHIVTRRSTCKADSLGIFAFIEANFESIVRDTLLPGIFKYQVTERDTLVRITSSHPSYAEVLLKTDSKTYSNGVLSNDVWDGTVRDLDGRIKWTAESINYQHNIALPIVRLISLLTIEQEKMEKGFTY